MISENDDNERADEVYDIESYTTSLLSYLKNVKTYNMFDYSDNINESSYRITEKREQFCRRLEIKEMGKDIIHSQIIKFNNLIKLEAEIAKIFGVETEYLRDLVLTNVFYNLYEDVRHLYVLHNNKSKNSLCYLSIRDFSERIYQRNEKLLNKAHNDMDEEKIKKILTKRLEKNLSSSSYIKNNIHNTFHKYILKNELIEGKGKIPNNYIDICMYLMDPLTDSEKGTTDDNRNYVKKLNFDYKNIDMNYKEIFKEINNFYEFVNEKEENCGNTVLEYNLLEKLFHFNCLGDIIETLEKANYQSVTKLCRIINPLLSYGYNKMHNCIIQFYCKAMEFSDSEKDNAVKILYNSIYKYFEYLSDETYDGLLSILVKYIYGLQSKKEKVYFTRELYRCRDFKLEHFDEWKYMSKYLLELLNMGQQSNYLDHTNDTRLFNKYYLSFTTENKKLSECCDAFIKRGTGLMKCDIEFLKLYKELVVKNGELEYGDYFMKVYKAFLSISEYSCNIEKGFLKCNEGKFCNKVKKMCELGFEKCNESFIIDVYSGLLRGYYYNSHEDNNFNDEKYFEIEEISEPKIYRAW